jgi:hypothetical protein
MDTKKLVVALMAVSLVSLCAGIVIAQPNGGIQSLLTSASSPPNTDRSLTLWKYENGTTPSVISPEPYIYPYYYGGFLEHFVQIIVNANNAQYEDLAMKTVNGVTTITAQKIDITSSYTEVHASSFKLVINKNVGTATLTASHLDYEENRTTLSGDNISFTVTFYPNVIPMVEDSGTTPPSRLP